MIDPAEALERARELRTYADGLDEARPELARRLRIASDELSELAWQLEAERSGRLALQVRYEGCLEILGKRAYDATVVAE